MTELFPLFLLWMFSRKGERRGHGHAHRSHDPHHYPAAPVQSVPLPAQPAQPTPPTPPLTNVVYHAPGASKWRLYAPLTPEVINRAEQILHTPTAAYETIEADPTHPGRQVRYLRTVGNPPGHTNVTAWMPSEPAGVNV